MGVSVLEFPFALIADSSIPAAPLSALVLSFFIYSVGGWVWESTACSLMNDGRFTNSGFLLGPVCPIYGVGALICWLFLRHIPGMVELFFVAAFVCCGLEWVVGLALEATTGARFWNYDDKPLNIQGRVCLYGFLLFGAGAVAICRLIEPAILGLLSTWPGIVVFAVAAVLSAVLAADLIFAMASWRRLSMQLESLRTQMALRLDESMGEASDRMLEAIPEPVKEGAAEVYERGKSAAGEACYRTAAAASGAKERAYEAAERTAERTKEAAEAAAQRARATAAGIGQASEMLREGIASRVNTASERPEWLNSATESLVNTLGKRDLRFFRAFPRMSFKRYDGVIKRAKLRERVSELFDRR